jgi:hypothetical protein
MVILAEAGSLISSPLTDTVNTFMVILAEAGSLISSPQTDTVNTFMAEKISVTLLQLG